MAIKPKQNWLDIEFLLPVEVTEVAIYKTFRVSRNRVAHFVRLDDPAEVTPQIMGWLKEAYALTGKG